MNTANNNNLQEIRIQLLDKMMWGLALIAGVSLLFEIFFQIQNGNYGILFLYLVVYSAIVLVAFKKTANYYIRAAVPLLLLATAVSSEFYFFGVTSISYLFMYTLIIFSAVLYGFSAALVSLGLMVIAMSARFWIEQYQISTTSGAPLINEELLFHWLSPVGWFVCMAAIAIMTVSMVLSRLNKSLVEQVQLVSSLTDEVANKHQAEEALDLSERQYSTLFERSNDALFLIDAVSGKHLNANHAAELLTGLSIDAIKNLSVEDLLPTASERILIAARNQEIDNAIGKVAYVRKGGEIRTASVHITPLADGRAFVIARDETERRKLEEQFIHSQKMEAVGQLAGGVAHDFNNSLHAMLGYAEMALAKLPEHEAHRDLEQLLEAGERARSLISQLLAFSRRQVLEMADINLSTTIQDLLIFMQRTIGEHIEFEFETTPEALMIRADLVQIEQILMNLCINARDAMSDGGTLSISVDAASIDYEFCRHYAQAKPGDYVRLSVADTGEGMSEQIQKRMFEPFFTTKETGKGTGLGLSTVFGIVEQHNGFIVVTSKQDCGTTINIYLPRSASNDVQEQVMEDEKLQTGTEMVLLADDDDMVREVTGLMLSMAGYTVVNARTGNEAIEVFDRNADNIDLVILDVVMPDLSGVSVSKQISQRRPETPVLFASGYSREIIDKDYVLDDGMHLIQKPFALSVLLSRVREILDNHPN